MKQLTLSVSSRQDTGRGHSQRLRKAGQVPAVLYGKSGARSLCIAESNLRQLMRAIGGSATLVEIKEEGRADALSIVKEVQRHCVTDKFLHVDLLEISANEEMRIAIPVLAKGEAFGVKNEGGVLDITRHTLEVRCLPKDLPGHIEVDVSALRVGDAIHVSELPKLAGVTYLADADLAVVSCSIAKAEIAETAATVATEGEAAEGADGAKPAAEGAEAAKPAEKAEKGGKK